MFDAALVMASPGSIVPSRRWMRARRCGGWRWREMESEVAKMWKLRGGAKGSLGVSRVALLLVGRAPQQLPPNHNRHSPLIFLPREKRAQAVLLDSNPRDQQDRRCSPADGDDDNDNKGFDKDLDRPGKTPTPQSCSSPGLRCLLNSVANLPFFGTERRRRLHPAMQADGLSLLRLGG